MLIYFRNQTIFLLAVAIGGCADVSFKLPQDLQSNSVSIPVDNKFYSQNKIHFANYSASSKTGGKKPYTKTYKLKEALNPASVVTYGFGLPRTQIEGEDLEYEFSLKSEGRIIASAECVLEHRYSTTKYLGLTMEPSGLVPISSHCNVLFPETNTTEKFSIEDKESARFSWGNRKLSAFYSDETTAKNVKSSSAQGYVVRSDEKTLFAVILGFKPRIIANESVSKKDMDLIAVISTSTIFHHRQAQNVQPQE